MLKGKTNRGAGPGGVAATEELKYWTYQELAERLICHPKTVARWVKFLNLRIFHPRMTTVRVPDSQAQKLFAATIHYRNADFPIYHAK